MNRVRNLFDLLKYRRAEITEDNKSLIVNYEIKSSHFNRDQETEVSKKRSFNFSMLSGKVDISFKKPHLTLSINLKTEDRKKLFQIFSIIAYLLGENILLKYSCENFPLPVPRGYNFGGYYFDFVNTKKLILKPIENIETGLKLMNDEKSFFSQILYSMLQINNIDLIDIRFFGEFVLLESLARKEKSKNTILNKKDNPDEYAEVNSLLKKIICKLDTSKILSTQQKTFIKRKLSFEKINNKGSTKEKILLFLGGLGEKFEKFKPYVNDWNKLRSSRIAHGGQKSVTNDEIILMKELHHLLGNILFTEFKEKLNNGIIK